MNSKLSSKLQDAHDNYFNFNYDENILRHVIEVEASNVDEEVCDVIKENANLPSVWNFFTSEEPITLFLNVKLSATLILITDIPTLTDP